MAKPRGKKVRLGPTIFVGAKERSRIAQRTKEALAAAKARGRQLGNPDIGKRNREAADEHAEALRSIVEPIANLSTRRIAAILYDRGIATARGGRWQSPTVMRLLDRLGLGR